MIKRMKRRKEKIFLAIKMQQIIVEEITEL